MVNQWRLYNEDGSVFDDLDGHSYESPVWGTIGVIQPSQKGRTATGLVGKNGDYLLYRSDLGVWHLVGASGLDLHLARYAHLIECIRPTFWMPLDSEFEKLWAKMRDDAQEAGYLSV